MGKRVRPEDKKVSGAPTTYNEKIAALICDRVATLPYGLARICSMFDDMPPAAVIYEWRWRHKEFADKYSEAKRAQMDLLTEMNNDLMDESLIYYIDEKGNKRIDSPSASIAIAKANNRKWYASKLAPKLYGDKVQEKTSTESLIEKLAEKLES